MNVSVVDSQQTFQDMQAVNVGEKEKHYELPICLAHDLRIPSRSQVIALARFKKNVHFPLVLI